MTAPPPGSQDKELKSLMKALTGTIKKFNTVLNGLKTKFSEIKTSSGEMNKALIRANKNFKTLNDDRLKKFSELIKKLESKDLKKFQESLNVLSSKDIKALRKNLKDSNVDVSENLQKAVQEIETNENPNLKKQTKEVDFNDWTKRQEILNRKQYDALNRSFASFGTSLDSVGGIFQELYSRDFQEGFEIAMAAVAETFVNAVNRSDELEKKALGLGRNVQSLYKENSDILAKLGGDSIENLAVALEFYSMGIRENTESLQKVGNRIRLTGGDYKLFAKSMASNMVSLRINAEQAGKLAESLNESSIKNGMSMDDLVQSITGLGKELTMFSAKGMGQDIAAAIGQLQAEAGIASQENIQQVAKMLLNSEEGVAMAAAAGVQKELFALGTKEGANKQNLDTVIEGISKAYDKQVKAFDSAITAGLAIRGSLFESMAPIAELQTSIQNMSQQQKHQERVNRDFTNTIATINEELLNPIKEFVVANMDSIKMFAKILGQLIKWGAILAGVTASIKAFGYSVASLAKVTAFMASKDKLSGVKDLFSGLLGTFKTTLTADKIKILRSPAVRGAIRGKGIVSKLTKVFTGLGPKFLSLGGFLAKGLLRFIPFLGTAMLLWDLGKMTYDALKGVGKNTEKTAEELERERQRRERIERQQVETVSTLDKTMIALINVTRNRDASLNASLQTIAQASQTTARNTVPKVEPIRLRKDVYGN